MSTITLSYSDMMIAAAALDAKQQSIAVLLSDMSGIADGLVTSDFKTVTESPAYDTTVNDTVTHLAQAIATIGQFADILRSTAKNYRDQDQALANKINGGSATDFLRIDMGEISALKSNLKGTIDAFNSVYDVSNVLNSDTLGDHGLADAVHNFAHDWDKKRGEILKSCDTVGNAVTGINDNFTQLDSDLTKNLQGGGH